MAAAKISAAWGRFPSTRGLAGDWGAATGLWDNPTEVTSSDSSGADGFEALAARMQNPRALATTKRLLDRIQRKLEVLAPAAWERFDRTCLELLRAIYPRGDPGEARFAPRVFLCAFMTARCVPRGWRGPAAASKDAVLGPCGLATRHGAFLEGGEPPPLGTQTFSRTRPMVGWLQPDWLWPTGNG